MKYSNDLSNAHTFSNAYKIDFTRKWHKLSHQLNFLTRAYFPKTVSVDHKQIVGVKMVL